MFALCKNLKKKLRTNKKDMQYMAVFSSTINMVYYGITFGWPSPSLPKLSKDSPIHISNSEGSWLSVIPMAGALIGDPLSAYLANEFGRRYIILCTAVPFIISALIIAFSFNFTSLMIARFLAGMGGAGLFTVVPTYIAEVTEPKIRGQLGAMLIWMWDSGVLLIYVCGPFVDIETMAFISIVIPVVFVLIFIWMPESPYFFMMKNRREEAMTILKIFREEDNIDKVIEEIEEQLLMSTNFLDIFQYSLNKKTLLLVLTLITVKECTGRIPFLFYSQKIFNEADKNIPAAYVSMIYGFILLISSFSGSFIIDKFKRKTLLIFSCTGTTVCLTLEGIYFFLKYYLQFNMESIKWLPVIALILFVSIYNVGLGIVPMTIAGELFPTNVKTNGLCFLDMYTAIIGIGISKFFQITSDHIGSYVPFWTFAVLGVLGILFIIKFLPETRGLSLEEIQINLKTRFPEVIENIETIEDI